MKTNAVVLLNLVFLAVWWMQDGRDGIGPGSSYLHRGTVLLSSALCFWASWHAVKPRPFSVSWCLGNCVPLPLGMSSRSLGLPLNEVKSRSAKSERRMCLCEWKQDSVRLTRQSSPWYLRWNPATFLSVNLLVFELVMLVIAAIAMIHRRREETWGSDSATGRLAAALGCLSRWAVGMWPQPAVSVLVLPRAGQ